MTAIFVDTHVHMHAQFDPSSALRWAATNIRDAARARGIRGIHQAVLCLAETVEADAFGMMARLASFDEPLIGDGAEWHFAQSKERETLYADDEALGRLILIAGRQVVTKERLEVLALGTIDRLSDGLALGDTLARIEAAGALAVLPWGVGKWVGGRGRLIRELLTQQCSTAVLLGDNGNRLHRWPSPRALAAARRRRVPVLPGSDPLPLPGEERRVGAYGCVLEGGLDTSRPARDLLGRLRDPRIMLEGYGRRESPLRFLRNQALMQTAKRFPRP